MSHVAIRIIREEHAALAAMLRSILLLMEQHRRHCRANCSTGSTKTTRAANT
jgi:hypothetical protein